jgi:Flp pilus assembly protein CpaB
MAARAIRLDPRDNVAVVTADVKSGDLIDADGVQVRATEPIPRGGKVALTAIPYGEPVLRYGEEIGLTNAAIAPGQHVHTHNLGGAR